MKLTAAIVLVSGLLSGTALAHGDPLGHHEVRRRANLSKRCEGAAAKMNEKRYANQMKKRWDNGRNTSFTIHTEAPYYDVIQNDTCIVTPDVTRGPYVWPRSEILRQDMTGGQAGVPLWLDIGVLDVSTCEPLEDVLVAFWHCNGTGSYSSFTGLDPNTDFATLLNELNVTDFTIGETDLHTDDTTFLRGMWPTNKEGMLEMKTIFPGFYAGRAIHIHTEVYKDWVLHDNGTVRTGDIVNVGQLFFNESVIGEMMALEPYASHTQINRTTNAEDTIMAESQEGGYNPVMSVVPADGIDIANGMIGYITMGVDLTDTTALDTSPTKRGLSNMHDTSD
ncbi:putative protocatechuate 3,4-dioxygenase beta subunit [Cryphonectria parasitica EP155]|uniref:Protocatechuate 3,4-dioxygenase beta subunit n=1 Tax=Cryphonectria parasitica (strain ATCC 38755 / EP155) TaxID=660469 RepID=A0A9P5CVL6_CRYP1|nr:putative protocatechuate 3,4-dioxygenase beta subunit [Cryphonectria parasitica EP155]KAF3771437.1 putative protocatechuate 3,4-dioxygenase beta subunit [Cryphonectria parasitica EP155]